SVIIDAPTAKVNKEMETLPEHHMAFDALGTAHGTLQLKIRIIRPAVPQLRNLHVHASVQENVHKGLEDRHLPVKKEIRIIFSVIQPRQPQANGNILDSNIGDNGKQLLALLVIGKVKLKDLLPFYQQNFIAEDSYHLDDRFSQIIRRRE